MLKISHVKALDIS